MEIEHMDSVTDYLRQTVPERKKWMTELESYAHEHQIPVMEPVSLHFLTQLVRMKKPQTILEIGTAIGYSALRMHNAYPTSQITTIEKNETMYQLALENIKKQEKESSIDIIFGDALEEVNVLALNNKAFDIIFIDAAKGQYKRFFELVQPLLKKDGIIICDNILFRGYVVDDSTVNNKRLQNLAKKIRDFNEWLTRNENYHTSIIPIGDGVSISIKKNNS